MSTEKFTLSESSIPILDAGNWHHWNERIIQWVRMQGFAAALKPLPEAGPLDPGPQATAEQRLAYTDALRQHRILFPTRPAEPEDDANQQVRRAYEKALAKYDESQLALAKASKDWEAQKTRVAAFIEYKCNAFGRSLIKQYQQDPVKCLEVLRDHFRFRGAGALIDKMNQFYSLNLRQCKNITEYNQRHTEIHQALEELGDGIAFSEIQRCLKYLQGLTPAWDMFVSAYHLTHSFMPLEDKKTVTMADLQREAYAEEQRIGTSADTTEGVAMIAQKGHRTIQVKHCDHCNRDYHTADECFKKHPHLKRNKEFKDGRRKNNNKRARQDEQTEEEDTVAMAAQQAQRHTFTSKNTWDTDHQYIAMVCQTALSTERLEDSWIVDSGCSKHISGCKNHFVNYTTFHTPQSPIQGIAGSQIAPEGKGTVRILCKVEGATRIVLLSDVLYCPGINVNLISVSQLIRSGKRIDINSTGLTIQTGEVYIQAVEKGGVYHLNLAVKPSEHPGYKPLQALMAHSVDPKSALWHARLGHMGERNMKKLSTAVKGMDISQPPHDECPCETCILTKIKRQPHKAQIRPGKHPMELIHADLVGPIPVVGLEGSRYFLHFLDDATGWGEVFPLQYKNDAPECFWIFKNRLERGEHRIRRFRTDNGEFRTTKFLAEITRLGIVWEPTVPDNPEQNGKSEKHGHLLWLKTTALLASSGLRQDIWPELVKTANYLHTRSLHAGKDKTPLELMWGIVPSLKNLRLIGSVIYSLLPRPNGHSHQKLKSKIVKGVLVGYEGEHIYRILTNAGKIIRNSNVHIVESKLDELQPKVYPVPSAASGEKRKYNSEPPLQSRLPHQQKIMRKNDRQDKYLPPSETIELIEQESLPSPPGIMESNKTHLDVAFTPTSPQLQDSLVDSRAGTPDETSSESIILTPAQSPDLYPLTPEYHRTRNALERHPNLRLPSESPDPISILALLSKAGVIEPFEPKTFREAQASAQWKEWKAAIDEEISSLTENKTWELTELPKQRSRLGGKWVFKLKRGADGSVIRYKARWVVQGFRQQEGIDYNETFASVVKPMSYKAIFAIAAALDFDIEQMDVKTAFLYGQVQEEIYVVQPTGCEDGSSRVCRLRKALYGLKQAPRVWYETFALAMKRMSFKPIDSDASVFSCDNIIVALYVDDLLIAGRDKEKIKKIKTELSAQFKMTDLGPCTYYLGMEVTRDRENRTLKLNQLGYIERVLEQFGMIDCANIDTPMDANLKLKPAEETFQAEEESKQKYQSAIGSLIYTILGTRPDIAFAVSKVSQFSSNPNQSHWTAVKRILRYLKTTKHYNLRFKDKLKPLEGYSDADYAGDLETRRSTGGYIFNIGSGAISWSSKRQPTISISSCESEVKAQTQATKEAIWLRRLLAEISGSYRNPSPTLIWCDNQGAIALAKNPQYHAKSKHIEVQEFFCREKVASGEVQLEYIQTLEQVADGLTKALPKDAFRKFRYAIGVVV